MELAPYYHKNETLHGTAGPAVTNKPNFFANNPQSHGSSGPIHTSFAPWRVPIEDSIIAAVDELSGVETTQDPWDGNHLGIYGSLSVVDARNGGRSYAATGYLAPNLHRSNLKVLTAATVCKILLNSEANTPPIARGVEFVHADNVYQVAATTEVLLCAGTIASPRLLELSGIGDPAILAAAGIECVLPQPEVGNNLREHPMTSIAYELAPDQVSVDSLFDPATAASAKQQFLGMDNDNGALNGAMGLAGFLPYTSLASPEEVASTVSQIEHNDEAENQQVVTEDERKIIAARLGSSRYGALQFVGCPANFDIPAGHADQSKLMAGAPPGRNSCYSFLISLTSPLSQGSSHITSADPFAAPRIDLGLLSHRVDADILAAGLDFADRVFHSGAVAGKVASRVSPAPQVNLQDRKEGREAVHGSTMVFNHMLGTCAMGRVADERLRVKGVGNLRVVDASVFPTQISGNIMATVYAVAEKASEIIREDRTRG